MKWTIQKNDEGSLIRDFLRNTQGFSRRILKSLIYDGGTLLVNNQKVGLRYILQTGDTITLEFPKEVKGNHMDAEDIPLDIIYEDESVLVINKQPGMATIPSMNHQNGTIANGVLYHYEKHNLPYTVHVVTRLDRDTSGLLLIAKHRYSHSLLSSLQRKGSVKRKYYAIVEGVPTPRQGIIDANIGRKEGSIIERTVREDGQHALTHFEVKQDNGLNALIAIQLETGRTHQIRVHFSHIGHPLVGDDLYGGTKNLLERQALHCYALSFEHPLTKETLSFEVEMPEDMKKILPEE